MLTLFTLLFVVVIVYKLLNPIANFLGSICVVIAAGCIGVMATPAIVQAFQALIE